jgi:glycosyltransferase involved in cell wall biosynthesis
VLRQLQPDVFHCQYIMPPRVKCKTVVSIHDLAYEHFPAMFGTAQRLTMKTLIPSAAKRADRILTLSQFCADDISRTYGIAREKIMVASPAVSEKFQPGDKLRARERLASKYRIESDFLLYVGRIQARKNLVRMVEAYARVRRQGATANLVIVGKPDYGAEQVFARIADLGLKEVVVFPGYVDGGDLPLFYQGAEAFVFPSLFEGFGLPVLESMACGIPTITSYGSSLEEVAGGAAVLVDPKSVDSIANAMEQILSSGEQRRDLGTRGLRRSADFTLENFVRQVLLVYESLA